MDSPVVECKLLASCLPEVGRDAHLDRHPLPDRIETPATVLRSDGRYVERRMVMRWIESLRRSTPWVALLWVGWTSLGPAYAGARRPPQSAVITSRQIEADWLRQEAIRSCPVAAGRTVAPSRTPAAVATASRPAAGDSIPPTSRTMVAGRPGPSRRRSIASCSSTVATARPRGTRGS